MLRYCNTKLNHVTNGEVRSRRGEKRALDERPTHRTAEDVVSGTSGRLVLIEVG